MAWSVERRSCACTGLWNQGLEEVRSKVQPMGNKTSERKRKRQRQILTCTDTFMGNHAQTHMHPAGTEYSMFLLGESPRLSVAQGRGSSPSESLRGQVNPGSPSIPGQVCPHKVPVPPPTQQFPNKKKRILVEHPGRHAWRASPETERTAHNLSA